MRIAFLTEMGFVGKISTDHPNMRTEFAWMHALNADHHPINSYSQVRDYDHIFVIFPKGLVSLNAMGSKLVDLQNPHSDLLASDWLQVLKKGNKKVYFVQEGPAWMFTELEIADQVHFYNMLTTVDGIFAHNESDILYYKGLVPNQKVHVMPTLMIEWSIKNISPATEDKAIVGGNFARWYGGLESFMVAQEFGVPIWGQTSHAMRDNEEQLVHHLPRVTWTDWIKQLSSFRYAVHLMPTVAAGTFSLNCAYLGIPCIGNKSVDTQRLCHPSLAVEVGNVQLAREYAHLLTTNKEFYDRCSKEAKENYREHYDINLFKQKLNSILV